jgi:hypothetical protein
MRQRSIKKGAHDVLGLTAPAELELIHTRGPRFVVVIRHEQSCVSRVHSSRQPPNNPIARSEPELPLRRRLHRSADRLVALLSDLR